MNDIATDQSARSAQGSQITDHVFSKRQIAANGGTELEQNHDIHDYPHSFLRQLKWTHVLSLSWNHALGLYAITRLPQFRLFTLVLNVVWYLISILGAAAGAHRLWTHRAYKAKLPLQNLLMLFQAASFQESIHSWCRNHRTHHKFSDTDADPHNSNRGLFFSHMGWFMMKKHPDVAKKGRTIFMDDLLKDPVVSFQRRYYMPLALTLCFILPTLISWYFGGETLWNAYLAATLRCCIAWHAVWTTNSLAHRFGTKPYDKQICPAENWFVNCLVLGEGFHNYHHAFPHDYATGEFGMKPNMTTVFIDMMAVLGQAYDCRVASQATIETRKRRTGELSGLKNAT